MVRKKAKLTPPASSDQLSPVTLPLSVSCNGTLCLGNDCCSGPMLSLRTCTNIQVADLISFLSAQSGILEADRHVLLPAAEAIEAQDSHKPTLNTLEHPAVAVEPKYEESPGPVCLDAQ